MNNPIGCAPIWELARGKSDAAIIINDTTRPTPSDLMLEALLGDLAKAGIREKDVTVIIACGNHRPNTREEIRRMVGDDLASRLQIINHDCNDAQNLVAIGATDTGIPVWVNAIVACSGISETELAQMFFTPASSPQAAIDTALDRVGPNARILVLPNAVNCVPRVAV